MKKIFLLLFAALFVAGQAPAQSTGGIEFESGSFTDVLKKAQESGKLVFMDCYAVWCGPCKLMAKEVFPQKIVGDYFNKNFINYKLDMEKGEGVDIAKKYGIKAYPTFLILNGDGKELGRIVGGAPAEEFIKKVQKTVEGISE